MVFRLIKPLSWLKGESLWMLAEIVLNNHNLPELAGVPQKESNHLKGLGNQIINQL